MTTYLMISIFAATLFLITLVFDFDHGHDIDHEHGGFLSMRAALLFGVGFGAGGTLAMQMFGIGAFPASLAGLALGVISAMVGIKTVRLFMAQESDSTVSLRAIIDCVGYVTVPITINGIGQIVVTDSSGATHYVSARATGPYAMGEAVRIVALIGTDAFVVHTAQQS